LDDLKDGEAWIARRAVMHIDKAHPPHAFVEAFFRLLDRCIEIITSLDEAVPWNTSFFLRHDDLSFGNVLVAFDDPSKIVGIVDWEGATVVSLWSYFHGDFILDNVVSLSSEQEFVELAELRKNPNRYPHAVRAEHCRCSHHR
jgi:hypothetical protein